MGLASSSHESSLLMVMIYGPEYHIHCLASKPKDINDNKSELQGGVYNRITFLTACLPASTSQLNLNRNPTQRDIATQPTLIYNRVWYVYHNSVKPPSKIRAHQTVEAVVSAAEEV